jgi:hypothetical protein
MSLEGDSLACETLGAACIHGEAQIGSALASEVQASLAGWQFVFYCLMSPSCLFWALCSVHWWPHEHVCNVHVLQLYSCTCKRALLYLSRLPLWQLQATEPQ